jgi:ribosomal protein S18 acetylase RimI-like enzyme
MNEPIDQVPLVLELTIRRCLASDLPKLEWFGMFTAHREIFCDAFKRQQGGENLMLVCDCNGFPIGQVWIDFTRKEDESVALIWALRIYPFLQNLCIGGRLLTAAEWAVRQRNLRTVEVFVEKTCPAARRFYERHGYEQVGEVQEHFCFRAPGSRSRRRILLDEWVLRKALP